MQFWHVLGPFFWAIIYGQNVGYKLVRPAISIAFCSPYLEPSRAMAPLMKYPIATQSGPLQPWYRGAIALQVCLCCAKGASQPAAVLQIAFFRGPTTHTKIQKKTQRSRGLFRKVCANFCLLPCEASQEPKRNCSEKTRSDGLLYFGWILLVWIFLLWWTLCATKLRADNLR